MSPLLSVLLVLTVQTDPRSRHQTLRVLLVLTVQADPRGRHLTTKLRRASFAWIRKATTNASRVDTLYFVDRVRDTPNWSRRVQYAARTLTAWTGCSCRARAPDHLHFRPYDDLSL